MKKDILSKLGKTGCVLMAATLVCSVCAKAGDEVSKTTSDSGIIDDYYFLDDAVLANELMGKGMMFSSNDNKVYKSIIRKGKEQEPIKVGRIVNVNGRGNEASDGSGKMGRSWKNEKMMVVGVREDRSFPYACAVITDEPGASDVMAWFGKDSLSYFYQETVEVKPATKILEDSAVKYVADSSYTLSGDKMYRLIISGPKYSDDAPEFIAKTYSINLK